jgi:hypothetical protein
MADDAGDDHARAMADAFLAHTQMEETQQYLRAVGNSRRLPR